MNRDHFIQTKIDLNQEIDFVFKHNLISDRFLCFKHPELIFGMKTLKTDF